MIQILNLNLLEFVLEIPVLSMLALNTQKKHPFKKTDKNSFTGILPAFCYAIF